VTDVVSVLRLFAAYRATLGHEAPSELDYRSAVAAPELTVPDTELYHGHSMSSKTPTALGEARQWGRVEVFPSAVAAIAGHAALGCYGIAGMAARGLRDGVAELLHRGSEDRGVEVVEAEGGLAIDVYVIVQYGIRISEVAHNLQEAVKFAVERSVNVPVVEVNVNVQGVREERR
jgi:uncharacterized alkaline shock family protein YloU